MPFKYVDDYNLYMKEYMRKYRAVNPVKPISAFSKLFQQVRGEYFSTYSTEQWTLQLCDEETWKQELEENFPNQDNSKTNSFSNYAKQIIYFPTFKKLSEQHIQELMIHEGCHLIAQRSGHGGEWRTLMLRAVIVAKKAGNTTLHQILLGDIYNYVLRQQVAKPINKFPRFPQKYRTGFNWF